MQQIIESIKLVTLTHSQNRAYISSLFNSINTILHAHCDAASLLKIASTKELCFLIYDLGKLASFSNVKIQSISIHWILFEMQYARHIDAKLLSNCFYGLGKLAESEKMEGNLYHEVIKILLQKLYNSNPENQGIANTLYGLGKVAERGLFEAPLPERTIEALLQQLQYSHPTSQNIGNTFHGLGKIAERGLLEAPLPKRTIAALLQQLQDCQPKAQELANTLYGLGKIVERGLLEAPLPETTIEALLQQLQDSHPTSQNIANTLYGLGKVAERGLLEAPLPERIIDALLQQLQDQDSHPNSQNISNTLHGLGKIAERGLLEAPLPKRTIEALLEQLQDSRPHAQAVANTFHGLGKIAEKGLIEAPLPEKTIETLLQQLQNRQPKAQEIANTLYGLGKIAERGLLEAPLPERTIEVLLQQLQMEPDSQAIANTLYGLGKIAERGLLVARLSQRTIEALVQKLQKCQPHRKDIANTLYAIGILIENTKLSWNRPSAEILTLLESQLNIPQLKLIDLTQIIYGISQLQIQQPKLIHDLFLRILNFPYVHPASLLYYIELFLHLSKYNLIDQNILTQFIQDLDLPYTAFTTPQQVKINWLYSQLPPNLREAFAQQLSLTPKPLNTLKPTPTLLSPTQLENALNNRIFKAIYEKNLRELERLLSVTAFSPRPVSTSSKNKNVFNFNPERTPRLTLELEVQFDNKKTANHLVSNFLQNTPREALKNLIQTSSHLYFIQILRACSKHHQYQLAIGHHLHLIMIHLPLNNMNNMVNALIDLGFYRDHQAALSLIESLSIRKVNHLEEEPELHNLQIKILERTIEFHQQHHRKVTAFLTRIHLEQLLPENFEASEPPQPDHEHEETSLLTKRVREETPPNFFQNSRHFQEDALQHPDGTPNMQAYYTSEHVAQLLKMTLESQPNLHILAPLDYHQAPPENTLRQQLLQYISEYPMTEPHHLIIPICIQQHWVGIRVKINRENIELSYYDSLPQNIHLNTIMSVAQMTIQDIYQGLNLPIQTRNKNAYHQNDSSSCGAYLIENIRLDTLNSIPKKSINARDLRCKHLEMLYPEQRYEHEDEDTQPPRKIRR